MLTVNKKFTIVRLLCAFAIAIALSVAVIFAVSEEPVTAIYNLFLGPLQSKRHFFEVFASSVPLIFTGLALGLVFKSGNFSMIADACLYTGAVVTAALAIKTSLPFAVHPIVIMIAAAAVGGLIGSIPALLKVYFHTNELVTSLMFNYVFFYLGIYNVTKFLADREEIPGDSFPRKADLRNELPCGISDCHCGSDPVIYSCIQDEVWL
mgnify:CR=1 FL=1